MAHKMQGIYGKPITLMLLKIVDLRRGKGSTAVFYHSEEDMQLLVHGDDLLALGDGAAHQNLEKMLKQKYDLRIEVRIGPESQDGTEMIVLGRILRYNKEDGSVEYEADPRHAEFEIREMGLENATSVTTPSIGSRDPKNDGKQLPKEDASRYRSVTMRGLYLAQDRGDIAEAVKCLTRRMQTPCTEDEKALKRLCRYLIGRPRVVIRFERQVLGDKFVVYCDSDHAGCLRTRRSISGTVVMFGRHCIKCSSGLQSTIALSAGDAEYYAGVKGAGVGLQLQSLLADWGIPVRLILRTDRNSAIGTASRRGLGKLPHVQTRYLWVQERVAQKRLAPSTTAATCARNPYQEKP